MTDEQKEIALNEAVREVQEETLLRLLDQLCHYVTYHKLSPEWIAPLTMVHLASSIAELRSKADRKRWQGKTP
jgi:hypothetical protein